MDALLNPQIWIALSTLTLLEVVLGIDNVIFISILAGKLPVAQQKKARLLGLGLAMLTRIMLLFSISWVMSLTTTLFTINAYAISGRDLILLGGGLFLLGKSTFEIHERLEGASEHAQTKAAQSFAMVIMQILILDVVFSLDSVITAVGMTDRIGVMITAVMIAVGVMMVFAGTISDFVHRHPTVKMLALSFLILIGANLVAEAFHQHIPKGYTYFAMGFSILVEMLNLKMRKSATPPVALREPTL